MVSLKTVVTPQAVLGVRVTIVTVAVVFPFDLTRVAVCALAESLTLTPSMLMVQFCGSPPTAAGVVEGATGAGVVFSAVAVFFAVAVFSAAPVFLAAGVAVAGDFFSADALFDGRGVGVAFTEGFVEALAVGFVLAVGFMLALGFTVGVAVGVPLIMAVAVALGARLDAGPVGLLVALAAGWLVSAWTGSAV